MDKKRLPSDKIILGIVLLLFIGAFLISKREESSGSNQQETVIKQKSISEEKIDSDKKDISEKLPQFIELGSESCIPCKMMQPIIEELSREYKGQMIVKFIDVYKNPTIAQEYKIRAIPTQIFLSPEGKEVARHIGFLPREEILEIWKKAGYEFVSKNQGEDSKK